VVPAAWVAGLVLILAGCTQPNQTATNSPEVSPSPSAAASPTPSVEPTPSETPGTNPSPSPAKLIIRTLPFHLGEVGVTYGAVTLVGAGGVKPYKWSISSGALPPGLALSSTGKATGKPTSVGTFSFVVRVDDAAGAAAGAPTSILVFRQLAFLGPTAVCGNSPSSCNLKITYTGGIPGGKVSVKVAKVTGAIVYKTTDSCATSTATATTSPPPGAQISASGGIMTLAAGPRDGTTWCGYQGTINFVLVAQSPCGSGLLCVSSNQLSVRFSI
jgi:hypothetical protein